MVYWMAFVSKQEMVRKLVQTEHTRRLNNEVANIGESNLLLRETIRTSSQL